eukprot:NODE_1117_length_2116_cov_61.227296_g944_i0.p1 GENE.NODE_1117_length_2116_cov_61.227296_g944_i0~~NODE_1117_length_2116_cov_61.227296_g944_i0.p1  ORF type:complete len:611 (-),score=129.97 NODE_1117_length_2116_cov_61.227296_g944_i0:212-2044(-)
MIDPQSDSEEDKDKRVGSGTPSDSYEPNDPFEEFEGDDPFGGGSLSPMVISRTTSRPTSRPISNPASCHSSGGSTPTPSQRQYRNAAANVIHRLHKGQSTDLSLKGDVTALLGLACHDGLSEMVEKLLKAKADVNQFVTSVGVTPLHLCCEGGHEDIAKMLLTAGATPNTLSQSEGVSPLYIASLNGNLNCVSLLIQHKADPYINAPPEANPIYASCQNGHDEILTELLQLTKDQNDWPSSACGISAFHVACQNGHIKIVEILLNNGWPIDGVLGGFSPLHIACMNGKLDIVQMLLKKGAQVDVECPDGSTALMAACQEGHLAVVQELLKYKCSLDIVRAADGSTALYLASEAGHCDVVRSLLDTGFSPNIATTLDGSTPLIVAAQFGRTELIQLLLDYRADIMQCRSRMGSCASPLFVASVNGHVDSVKLLLENNADPNIGSDEETPLYVSCREGFEEVALHLIERKADINTPVLESGYYPLHVVAESGHIAATKILLKYNANIDPINASGATPLLLAVENCCFEIVKLLLEYVADPNPSLDSPNILETACLVGSDEIVSILLEKGAKFRNDDKDPSMVHKLIDKLKQKGYQSIIDKIQTKLNIDTSIV